MIVYLAGPVESDAYRAVAHRIVSEHYPDMELLDPFRPGRDFRGFAEDHILEIVNGDLADVSSADAVLADFSIPDSGTAIECWHAFQNAQIPVVGYASVGANVGPWLVHVSTSLHRSIALALNAVSGHVREFS